MKPPLLLLLSFLIQVCQAQLPDNFEFLDHNQRWSQLGANLFMEDSIMYVSHNLQGPMTDVKVAHTDNTVETIFESFFSGESKVVHNQDGTSDIFIYNLIDYDVVFPGFYAIHFANGSYTIEKYDYETFEDFNYDLYAFDVVREIDSLFWLIRFSDLAQVSNGKVRSVIKLDQDYYKYNLYKNSNDLVYIYDDSKLFRIHLDSLDLRLEFSNEIIDISTHQDKSLVLFEKSLNVYDSDFTTLIHSWDLPGKATSVQNIQLTDDCLYFLSVEGNTSALSRITMEGNPSVIMSGTNDNESVKGFNFINDSTFLFKGDFSEAAIYSNVFFRNVLTYRQPDYFRLNFKLNEFKLHRTGKDSVFNHVIVDGDSIFTYNLSYDYDVSFENSSDSVITTTNIFSRSYYNFFGPQDAYFGIDFSDTIAPGENVYRSGSFDIPLVSGTLADLKIVAPGANNRFNASPSASIIADFTSTLHEPAKTPQDILLYPNPTADFIVLKSGVPWSSYRIYDTSGILNQAGTSSGPKIDVSLLEPSSYILVLLDSEGYKLVTRQFVKL